MSEEEINYKSPGGRYIKTLRYTEEEFKAVEKQANDYLHQAFDLDCKCHKLTEQLERAEAVIDIARSLISNDPGFVTAINIFDRKGKRD